MTYSQPSADNVAKVTGEIFRLNTLLTTAGDIFESTQSAFAFALGPLSDISKVEIAYYDPQAQASGFISQIEVSNTNPWRGQINARLDTQYLPAKRPGRILIWPAELYNLNYRPAGFSTENDTIEFVTPRLDVIQYLKPQAEVLVGRVDREFLFERLPIPLGSLNLVLPYYGRRFASFAFTNKAAATLTGSILGVNYGIGDNLGAAPRDQEKLLASLSIVAGAATSEIVTATADGMFDALVLQVSYPTASTGPLCTRVTFSDTEA